MVDKLEGPRNPKGRTGPEIIDISSDEEDGVPQTPVRHHAGSKKQKHAASGSRPYLSQSQTNKSHTASKTLAATARTDSKSSQTGSQSSRVRSHEHSKRSSPSANNLTLAQRTAGREFSSGQVPKIASSSNGTATSPPASQVQISRGVHKAGSTVPSGMNSTRPSSALFGTVSKTKRGFEQGSEAEETPAAKRLKASQDNGRSTNQPHAAKRPTRLSGTHQSIGAGDGSRNAIVIEDSPPPLDGHHRNREENVPKKVRKLASKSAGRPPGASSPKPKATKTIRHEDTRRSTLDQDTAQGPKSPTIPESLPGSPPERHRASTVTGLQSPSLPLFIQPSEEISGNSLDTDIESISNFAEQAEAILASQTDDASTAAAATQTEQRKDDGAVVRPSTSSLKYPHRVAVLQSAPKEPNSPIARPYSDKSDMPIRDHNKPSTAPRRILPDSTMSNLTSANRVEHAITRYVQELRTDNAYWTRTWLKRARQKAANLSWSDHAPTSVFRNMRPIQPVPIPQDERAVDLTARFAVETFSGGGKSSQRACAVPCTMYHTSTDADVPNYSHFVNIKHSFLARNETVLQHWPYFHDDFDMRGAVELEEHYYLDVDERERKIKRLAQAENYAAYVEDMLHAMGCTWSDVLRFLLDPGPNVGTNPEALIALRDREKFCDEDFVRGGQRWTTVLSKLPPNYDPDQVGMAGLFCEYFKRIAKFQLWHVARRSAYTTTLLEEKDPKVDLNELTCRVCMRFSCPYHGEMHETASGDSDSERDGSAAEDIVETDIIHPYRVNYRSRVEFPPTVDTDEINDHIDPRRKRLEYWHKLSLNHYPDSRPGPFYPCYHPGKSCEKSRCSCFENRIPCEKSCGCDSSCKFRWQGCDCRMKGGMICFEDARCACFQNGRECDADLCGDCGVSDVLDPIHRHDDGILKGRCHNASIQRGIPRHTILGDSGIHGLGLYACEEINHHDFVGEYKGEIITKEEAERRGAVYEHQKLSYLFSLNNKQEVDSTLFGTKVRFINHASEKQANLYPRIIMVNTVFRIALYGARPIAAGQELLFDYGPQFPQDQLGVSGNKASKGGKAAPHVRNKNLVAQFDEVVESVDRFGNRRARKAAAGDKRGRFASKGSGAGSRGGPAAGGGRNVIARKSTAHGMNSHRGNASRPRRGDPDDENGDDESMLDAFDDVEDWTAGKRLSDYNVADDDETDDFAPHSDDRRLEESSSVDGDDEDEDDEDDGGAFRPTRPRSSRRRL